MIGELVPGELFLPESFFSMPTAIVGFYTSEGFAIGADRRRGNSDTGAVSDDSQKIFKVQSADKAIAWAFAGTPGITPEGSQTDVVVNILASTQTASESLSGQFFPTLRSYAERLAHDVNERMEAQISNAKGDGKIVLYPTDTPDGRGGFAIAYLFLLGYVKGNPGMEVVTLWHRDQMAYNPTVQTCLVKGYPPRVGYGPDAIFDLIYNKKDARLSGFVGPIPETPEALTLKQAVEACANFVNACQSDVAKSISDKCNGVGGWPVIATVRPSEGFEWVPGYEPPEGQSDSLLIP